MDFSALCLVLLAAALAGLVHTAPAPLSIIPSVHIIGIDHRQFQCRCPSAPRTPTTDTFLITCSVSSMPFWDSACHSYYALCECDPNPLSMSSLTAQAVLKKRMYNPCFNPFANWAPDFDLTPNQGEGEAPPIEGGGEDNNGGNNGWPGEETITGPIILPKEPGETFLSFFDEQQTQEMTYEITQLIKKPSNNAHEFNVYRVKDSKGKEFILREAIRSDMDMSEEITVLKKVKQFVAKKSKPDPNVVVEIQPGRHMWELMDDFVRDKNHEGLQDLLNGGYEALTELHELGILHGDPHMGNIMVAEDPFTFKFIDFGDSVLVGEQDADFHRNVKIDDGKYRQKFLEWLREEHGMSATIREGKETPYVLIVEE